MYCQHCSRELPQGDRFCKYCGAPVAAPPPPGQAPPVQPDRSHQQPPQAEPEPHNSFTKGCLIAVIITVALVILLGIALIMGFCSLVENFVDSDAGELQQWLNTAEQYFEEGMDGMQQLLPQQDAPQPDLPERPLAQAAPGQVETPQYAYQYLGLTVQQAEQLLGDGYSIEYWNGSDSLSYSDEGLMLFYGHTGPPATDDTISSVLSYQTLPACPGVQPGLSVTELEAALGYTLTLEWSEHDLANAAYHQGDGYGLLLFFSTDEDGTEVLSYYLVKM